ncbi:MAG: Gfo/Idh/MocA family oxidoreductase [Clostridiales bacterium]|jgi:predicted dehydrogenase|nr:Gfo/Idh/MocA family oxidoreductase [Clostridiales bacterium]
MLNVGIISAWHVHANGYAKEIAESGKARIAAVWDEDPRRGKPWAEQRGAEFIEDYDAFLARKDITAVVCNSPTTMHPELIGKAVAARKDVFTEKLLATTTADCETLCKAIEAAGITFTISLPLLPTPRVLYVKQLIDNGLLGKVTGARFRRSHSGVSDHWLPDYWFDVSKTGGGAMMDLGAHPVYILSFLFGEPKRVSGMMTSPYSTSSDENAIAVVEFKNGVLGTCETAFVTLGVPDLLEVYGTEGSVFVHGSSVLVSQRALAGLGVKEVEPASLPEGKKSPIMQFVDACVDGTGTPKHLGTAAALSMTKIIEASYISSKTGKYVEF